MTASVPAATSFFYTGDGVTTGFSFPLRFLENADVQVYVDGVLKTLTTHYTLSGAGGPSGGTVTFVSAPAAAADIEMLRNTLAKQTVDLSDSGRTPGDTLETQLDRLALVGQDQSERVDAIEALADDFADAIDDAEAAATAAAASAAAAATAETNAETAEANAEAAQAAAEAAAASAASKLPLAGGTMTGAIAFSGPAAALYDPSSVAGSAAEFFFPDYFGNPALGIVHRLNRVLVGVAAATSSDTPPDTQDWLETLAGSTTRGAQLAAISAIGNLGVLGAARTSDFRSWAGAASGGAQGVTGFGWNDDTGAGNPIAVGGEFRGFRKAGVTGITAGAQISGGNEGTTVDITPSGGVVAGSTMALLLTNGPAPTGYVNPISAAMVVGSGALSAVSRKGLIFLADSLDTSLGGGAAGIAIEMARSQSIRWLNSSSGVDAEMWANANGLSISGTARIGAALANYYTISGSASTQPVISVDGSSTDIDLILQAKGLGINMLRNTDAQTAAVAIAAQLRHILSSGTAAVGIGVGQNFVVPNASGSNKIVATQEAIATNVTNGTENADLVWRLMVAGAAAAEKLRLKSTGELNLATGGTIAVNGTKVMGARDTGWGAMTGTADKATAYATGTVTLAQLAGRVMAIQAALTTHGLLGA